MTFSGKVQKLSDADAAAMRKVQRIIEAFQRIDHKIPSTYIAAFIAVALDPGKGPTQYAKALNSTQPLVSRFLLEIGQKSRYRDEPLGLVDRDVSPHSLREQEYFLTPRGRALVQEIVDILEG